MTQEYDRSDPAPEWPSAASAEETPTSLDREAEPEGAQRSGSSRRRSRRRSSDDSGSRAAGEAAGSDTDEPPRRRRRSRSSERSDAAEAPETPSETEGGRPRRRRGGRGRRGKGASSDAERGAAPESGAAEDEGERSGDAASGAGRSSRRGRSRRGRRSDEETRDSGRAGGETDGPNEPASDEGGEGDDAPASEGRSRRRRGGRRRRRSVRTPGDDEAAAESDEASGPSDDDDGGSTRKRRRRSRSRSRSDEGDAADEGEDGDAQEERSSGRKRRRGKRGGRKRSSESVDEGAVAIDGIPGGEDFEDLEPVAPRSKESSPKAAGRKKKRGRKSDKEAPADEAPAKANVILVNASDPDETRVAVVEESRLVDFQMTVKNQVSLVNDIYRGRVVNLEPAIGAAFIDFGQGRNGFLHTSDVLSCYGDDDWDLRKLLSTEVDADDFAESSQPDVKAEMSEDDDGADEEPKKGKKAGKKASRGRHRARPRRPITELLQKGGSVVVQVTKDAIGDKGPTLTTYISIPGRHLVLMPSVARTGVSRKIEDEKERRRLKRILKGLDVPDGMGVIVRTAGIGATKAELKRDLEYLLLAWESFGKRLTLGRGPIALYEESDVALRVIRDLFTDETERIVVDDEKVHERMVEFTKRLVPDAVDRIELHDGPRPLFHTYGVEQDFEKIFARRVDLASGGSIVFDQAEALVAIDVNSGKTRSDGFDFEDVALKTNLEAVPEIARQIRLRDLGGIVVIDFIDMMRMANRRAVERAFRAALVGDRARSKVGRISQFGLLEMTRQRLGAGMSKMLFSNCPRCRGTGRARNVESRAVAILRRLGSALTLKGFTKVEVRAHPDTIEFLKRNFGGHLSALERQSERKLTLTPVPDQIEDSVLRYLRADGREVRPGGRRKR